MSSIGSATGLSFTGLGSGIDTSTIVTGLLKFQQQNINNLTAKKSSIAARQSAFDSIGTQLAALQAQAQLETTTDPAVRAALEATVEDESRHAELAWKVVAWAVRQGGARVRAVAERAFSEFRAPPAPTLDLADVDLRAFAEHGRLTPERARAVALEALETVVRPCAAGLFEQDVFERNACTTARPQ